MTLFREELEKYADPAFADFQAKLIPGVSREKILGVRVPALREFAKTVERLPETEHFLSALPHGTLEENLLHSILLSRERDFSALREKLDRFLPYIDNWAVCDVLKPAVFRQHLEELLELIPGWLSREGVYEKRFALEMLMSFFLDNAFTPEILSIAASVRSDEYYLNMMIAWFFATALAKQWDSAVCYLENGLLAPWVHQKTIRKACESYRISKERKAYLKTLK